MPRKPETEKTLGTGTGSLKT